ncbi:UNVERIFIED_CONTAM: hypothetical protein Slati_2906700 [Sesamum latifolium]|uniref:Uncharacterized protein n=1 Tax=Sesamum latifolium TaxID=2727402 RepID=A0AAW2VEA9_9LAMI
MDGLFGAPAKRAPGRGTLSLRSPAGEIERHPFSEEAMADELSPTGRSPIRADYDGTTKPQEHCFDSRMWPYFTAIQMESNVGYSLLHLQGQHNNGSTTTIWFNQNLLGVSLPFLASIC